MIMKLRFGSMGYKKLPALAQIILVFENLHRLRWEWVFNGKDGS